MFTFWYNDNGQQHWSCLEAEAKRCLKKRNQQSSEVEFIWCFITLSNSVTQEHVKRHLQWSLHVYTYIRTQICCWGLLQLYVYIYILEIWSFGYGVHNFTYMYITWKYTNIYIHMCMNIYIKYTCIYMFRNVYICIYIPTNTMKLQFICIYIYSQDGYQFLAFLLTYIYAGIVSLTAFDN